ncbi:MAG: phage tail protein [bacterium]
MFTTEGLALFALWEADPALKRKIKFMALGDLSPEQYADPDLYDGSESTLHDEKVRVEVNRVYQATEDPAIARVEAIINPEVRGWHIREVGLLVEGETPEAEPILVWIGKHPETFVPVDYQDMIVGEIITVPIKFGSADAVELFTTNAGLATIQYAVDAMSGVSLHVLRNAEEIGLIKNKIFGG